MIELLTRLFVRNSQDTADPRVRQSYGNLTAAVGIIINILLFAGKYVAGTLTSSVSICADAINNLSDAGSSVIAFVSFKISSKPADRKHPFGHARIEYIASILVSFFIMHLSIGLFTESIDRIMRSEAPVFSAVSIAVLSVSVAAKLWLYAVNLKIGRKIDSSVMSAAAADSLSDVLATSGVLISVIISKITGFNTDGYMGIAVAVLIFISGLKILSEASNHLLGTPPDPGMINQITEFVKKHDEVLGVHDIVIHSYGPGRTFSSMHIEVDGKKDVFKTHDAIDNIERDLSRMYGIHCAVHLDPIVTDDELVCEMREKVGEIVRNYNSGLTMHDFRMITGPTHSNLIFDILVPYENRTPADEIKAELDRRIKEIDSSYYAVIAIDKG